MIKATAAIKLSVCFSLLLLIALAGLYRANDDPQPASTAPLQLGDLLSGAVDPGFSRALAVRPFHFPTDHGAHPDFRTEWWYLTGNLSDQQQRRYGYQLTFFRQALQPSTTTSGGWQDSNLYMAHFAISDHSLERFSSAEKFGRNGANVAGVSSQPFRVWIDDWHISSANEEDFFPLQLQARNDQLSLNLTLTPLKPLVLQGDKGLSQKSAQAGNASYYYSYTRLQSSGQISYADQVPVDVTGYSWLDREWSSSALSSEQQGWDWFSLQLNSGEDIMFYRLRHHDGSTSPFSAGVIVPDQQDPISLSHSQLKLTATEYWQHQGHRYPTSWRMEIEHPAYQQQLLVKAVLKQQLLELSVHYWEGAVEIFDPTGTQSLGYGFVEMTGY